MKIKSLCKFTSRENLDSYEFFNLINANKGKKSYFYNLNLDKIKVFNEQIYLITRIDSLKTNKTWLFDYDNQLLSLYDFENDLLLDQIQICDGFETWKYGIANFNYVILRINSKFGIYDILKKQFINSFESVSGKYCFKESQFLTYPYEVYSNQTAKVQCVDFSQDKIIEKTYNFKMPDKCWAKFYGIFENGNFFCGGLHSSNNVYFFDLKNESFKEINFVDRPPKGDGLYGHEVIGNFVYILILQNKKIFLYVYDSVGNFVNKIQVPPMDDVFSLKKKFIGRMIIHHYKKYLIMRGIAVNIDTFEFHDLKFPIDINTFWSYEFYASKEGNFLCKFNNPKNNKTEFYLTGSFENELTFDNLSKLPGTKILPIEENQQKVAKPEIKVPKKLATLLTKLEEKKFFGGLGYNLQAMVDAYEEVSEDETPDQKTLLTYCIGRTFEGAEINDFMNRPDEETIASFVKDDLATWMKGVVEFNDFKVSVDEENEGFSLSFTFNGYRYAIENADNNATLWHISALLDELKLGDDYRFYKSEEGTLFYGGKAAHAILKKEFTLEDLNKFKKEIKIEKLA